MDGRCVLLSMENSPNTYKVRRTFRLPCFTSFWRYEMMRRSTTAQHVTMERCRVLLSREKSPRTFPCHVIVEHLAAQLRDFLMEEYVVSTACLQWMSAMVLLSSGKNARAQEICHVHLEVLSPELQDDIKCTESRAADEGGFIQLFY